jgi:hypothetical protein
MRDLEVPKALISRHGGDVVYKNRISAIVLSGANSIEVPLLLLCHDHAKQSLYALTNAASISTYVMIGFA